MIVSTPFTSMSWLRWSTAEYAGATIPCSHDQLPGTCGALIGDERLDSDARAPAQLRPTCGSDSRVSTYRRAGCHVLMWKRRRRTTWHLLTHPCCLSFFFHRAIRRNAHHSSCTRSPPSAPSPRATHRCTSRCSSMATCSRSRAVSAADMLEERPSNSCTSGC